MAIQIEKKARVQIGKSQLLEPDITDFPYTHGETVEKRRAQLAAERKLEMLQQQLDDYDTNSIDSEQSVEKSSRNQKDSKFKIRVKNQSTQNLPEIPIPESEKKKKLT